MIELVSAKSVEVLSPLIRSIVKHMKYPFNSSGNMEALEKDIASLVALRDDVENKVQVAERQGLTRTNQVQNWLDKVETLLKEAKRLQEKHGNGYQCVGHYSINYWSKYSISKDAVKKLHDVQELIEKGNFQDVAYQQQSHVREVPVACSIFPKEDADFQRAREYVEIYDVGIIGIWGMGGVGKTHLLRRINNSYKESSTFDNVILVTVSKGCSERTVQSRISEKLNLVKKEDIDLQASIILDYLKERNFLLLLDDVWDRIDLEAIGIPHPLGVTDQYKRKVIITTRSADICGQMEVRKDIRVACLEKEEAWRLFEEKVGKQTLYSNPSIASLAQNLVEELAGLPLALIIIGRTMHAKRELKEWEHAISLIQTSHLHEIEILGEQDSIFHRLKFSYDSLSNDTLRQCFLACSLWPEDYEIGKWELLQCWMGLGLLEGPDMPSIMRSGYAIIGSLLAACLLEDVDGRHYVKMHDVIRDMALWIACDFGKNKNKWVVNLRNEIPNSDVWHKAERIALWNGMDSSIIRYNMVACPSALTTLTITGSVRSLPNMQSFRVLTYLDLSRCELSNLPSEIFEIISLVHLDLSHNELESFPKDLRFLTNLKYIYLSNNPFQEVPGNVFSNIKLLNVIGLSDIGKFNALSYAPSFFDEMNSLHNLKALDVVITDQEQFERFSINVPIRSFTIRSFFKYSFKPHLVISDEFLGKTDIQKNLFEMRFFMLTNLEKIVIESAHHNSNWKLQELESLEFIWVSAREIFWKKVVPEFSLVRLRYLIIHSCRNLTCISWALHLPQLEVLSMRDCIHMQQMVTEDDDQRGERRRLPVPTFPCLRKFSIHGFDNLNSICSNPITFPSLEELRISNCPKLKKLPFLPGTIPSKLKVFKLDRTTWEALQWDNDSVRLHLKNFIVWYN